MFPVSRDSNCFQSDDDGTDDNPRTAGVYELLEIFAYPAVGIVIIFGVLLLNNYASLKKQKAIHKRFITSSVQKWHMHNELKKSLEGLRQAEKFKRQEFAARAEDTRVWRQMKDEKERTIKKLETQIGNMSRAWNEKFKDAEAARKYEKKLKCHNEAEQLKKKKEELQAQLEKLQTTQYDDDRRHKYGGIFSNKEAGNVLWSPTDTVLNYLKNRSLLKQRKVWQQVRQATIDEIYR